MNIVKNIIMSIAVISGLIAVPVLVTSPVAAQPQAEICRGSGGDWDGKTCNNANSTNDVAGFMKQIINILLYVLGSIAVLMIVIGGIRYVVSGGDQKAVTDAKNTILYAVIGLVVALMAYAIVNFVVLNVK